MINNFHCKRQINIYLDIDNHNRVSIRINLMHNTKTSEK